MNLLANGLDIICRSSEYRIKRLSSLEKGFYLEEKGRK
jgi:hypothetical protein